MISANIIPWGISAIALLITILSFARSGKQGVQADEQRLEGIRESILKANMKLDQVCATTNETRSDIKALNKDIQSLDIRISVVERDLKTAFAKIDEMRDDLK